MKLFEELKRRNVFRVGFAYLIVAWLLLQVADLVLENIDAPNWIMQVFMLAVAIGFPFALILAWAFEMTPEGIKRESEVERGQSITPQTGKKLDRMIIAVMGVVIVFLLVDRFYLQPRAGAAQSQKTASTQSADETSGPKSIAVLPFADLSQDQDQGWFADGLAEEILNALARTPDLLVSSRTSSFKYKGSDLDVPEIARELGVAHVLEGSVRSGGDRIRVTAQLIRASDGFHLWSENYDRDKADMIEIQEDLARNIAKALETTMDPAALAEMTQVGTRSVAAYEQYLRGVDQSFKIRGDGGSGFENLLAAYQYFEEARRLDPEFGRAHLKAADYWRAQLSPTRTDFGSTDLTMPARLDAFNERIEMAIEHAASTIDRTLYLATQAIMQLRLNDALEQYQAYLAERPNDLDAIGNFSNVAVLESRPELAAPHLETAKERAKTEVAAAVYYLNQAHRIIGAETAADFIIELANRYHDRAAAQYQAHRALLWAGRHADARRAYERFMQLQPDGDPLLQARQACVDGDRAAVEALLDQVDVTRQDGMSEKWHLLMLLDRKQEAAELLRPLTESGVLYQLTSFLIYAQFDPRPYPAVMAVLNREGIRRPPPADIPFKCPPPAATSIAVLPFVNMSADAENEFFSDGVSEEILNVLARIPELKVAARTSAFAYKGMNTKIADIARELGVNHVLEGSVRKVGDQVRVTAQLIKADDGFHLWSETYDRKLDNIFAIQDEIATAIAAELKVSLGLEAGAAGNLTGTSSLAAYEHYLQGMSLWHQRTAQSLLNAANEFIAAINLDEGFAKAHAGLAMTFAVIPGYITTDVEDAIERTLTAANRALELDPQNAEAMAALGITARYQVNYAEATKWFEQAIELNPSFATAHQWYGVVLEHMGDLDASLRLLERAWALDPRSRIIGYNLAFRLWGTNRVDEALEVNRRVREFAPDFPDAAEQAMLFAIMNGDCDPVPGYANRVATLLNKQINSADTYVALCRAETAEQRAEVLETIFSWAPLEFVDPEDPTLTYPYDLRLLLVELGEFDAVYELLDISPEDDLELGNLRGLRTPRGIEFQCQERWRELERQAGLPEPVDPVPCPE